MASSILRSVGGAVRGRSTGRGKLACAASLALIGLSGCTAEVGSDIGENSIDTKREAVVAPECVQIVQKYDFAALRFYSSSSPVDTAVSWSPAASITKWCLQHDQNGLYRIYPSTRHDVLLDAYQNGNDHEALVNTPQGDGSQLWTIYRDNIDPETWRFVQASSGRFLDAYTTSGVLTRPAVTRTPQSNDTQRWYILESGCNCE